MWVWRTQATYTEWRPGLPTAICGCKIFLAFPSLSVCYVMCFVLMWGKAESILEMKREHAGSRTSPCFRADLDKGHPPLWNEERKGNKTRRTFLGWQVATEAQLGTFPVLFTTVPTVCPPRPQKNFRGQKLHFPPVNLSIHHRLLPIPGLSLSFLLLLCVFALN